MPPNFISSRADKIFNVWSYQQVISCCNHRLRIWSWKLIMYNLFWNSGTPKICQKCYWSYLDSSWLDIRHLSTALKFFHNLRISLLATKVPINHKRQTDPKLSSQFLKKIPSKTWHCFLGLIDKTSSYSGLRKRRKYKQFFSYCSSLGTKQWLITIVVESGMWNRGAISELLRKAHIDQNSFHHWYAMLSEGCGGTKQVSAMLLLMVSSGQLQKRVSLHNCDIIQSNCREDYVKYFICRTSEGNKVQTFVFWMFSCENYHIKWYF